MSEGRDQVFIGCSHRDGRWREQLLELLGPLHRDRKLDVWTDLRLRTDDRGRREIDPALRRARIVVLLVSAAFLASDFVVKNDLAALLEGAARDGVAILWIPVQQSRWRYTAIEAYQAAHDPARPLDRLTRSERGPALLRIAERILQAVQPEPSADGSAGAETATGRDARQRLFMVPHARNPHFAEREAALTAIGEALQQSRRVGIAPAIGGPDGVGKSQTALEYAYRHRDDYKRVFCVGAESEATLDRDYAEIARRLGLAVQEMPEAEAVRQAVMRWLEEEAGYLLILDNADVPAQVASYLPSALGGHLLVTSRERDLSVLSVDRRVELGLLADEDAVAFLLARTGRSERPAEWAAAVKLARQLGGLPPALELAGAYIVAQGISFGKYLARFQKPLLGLVRRDGPEQDDAERRAQTPWEASFTAMRGASRAAADLLTVSAFFAPGQIPYELPILGARELGMPLARALRGAAEDESLLWELLSVLDEYSLIERDPGTKCYSVPRLVQEMIRAPRTKRGNGVGLTAAERRTWAYRAVRGLARAFPPARQETWLLCERLLPHALAGARWIETEGLESKGAELLLSHTGRFLWARGQHTAAEQALRQALAISESLVGQESPQTAASLNSLAFLCQELAELYYKQGKLTEAEPLCERALAIHWRRLGPEHPQTADSLNKLAFLYRAQGKLAEAGLLRQRALAARESMVGAEQLHTAYRLLNQALLYQVQGKLAEAESLFQQTLAIWERELGPEYPATADCLYNLAEVYKSQGKLAEAEPLYLRALAILERAWGPEHPHSVTCRENLANLRAEIEEKQRQHSS